MQIFKDKHVDLLKTNIQTYYKQTFRFIKSKHVDLLKKT